MSYLFVHFLDGPKIGMVEMFRGPKLPHLTWVVPLRLRSENPFAFNDQSRFQETTTRIEYEVFSRAKDKDFEHWYYRLTMQGRSDYMKWLENEQSYFGHKEKAL